MPSFVLDTASYFKLLIQLTKGSNIRANRFSFSLRSKTLEILERFAILWMKCDYMTAQWDCLSAKADYHIRSSNHSLCLLPKTLMQGK